MDFPYHFRALAPNGATIRQSTAAYPTVESCQEAAARASRMTGEDHVVCESLEPIDPRNKAIPGIEGKPGFCVYVAPAV